MMDKKTKILLDGVAIVIVTILVGVLPGMNFHDFGRGYMWNTVPENCQSWMLFGVLSRVVLVIAGSVGAFLCFIWPDTK